MATVSIERTRQAWTSAQGFPTAKETVYAGHAEAHGFDTEAGKTVLEYGCGGGSDTLSLLRRGCTVYFADVTTSNVEVTKQRIQELEPTHAERAHALPLDASDRIPLADGVLDAVTSHGVIHHIEDPVPVLKEFFRILKPGGRVYIMLYTEALRARADEVVHKLAAERGLPVEEGFCWFTDGPGHPWADFYTVEEGQEILTEAGFVVKSCKEYNPCVANENRPDFRTFLAVKPA
jgi:ubiquinone/menaquinone biosynthesis C-methylase UbiE